MKLDVVTQPHAVMSPDGTYDEQMMVLFDLDGGEWSVHDPAALSPEKEPLVPICYKVGWAPEPFWTRW
jgi:hypothetical protein